ncbi:MAG: hypothetical protein WC718_07905 [Phycisphaerales bacterium]|jgi:hypothetical protein
MPQEVKANGSAATHAKDALEGTSPALATEADLRVALDNAFSYRGDITLKLKAGTTVEGYLFDRRPANTLAASTVRLLPKDKDEKITISYADITGLTFSGKDTAAGKTFENWIKRYFEKKAAGEKAEIESEKLD